jgi:hypothetical protein
MSISAANRAPRSGLLLATAATSPSGWARIASIIHSRATALAPTSPQRTFPFMLLPRPQVAAHAPDHRAGWRLYNTRGAKCAPRRDLRHVPGAANSPTARIVAKLEIARSS